MMKHFIVDGQLYALEDDGSQDFLIQDSWIHATPEEVVQHQTLPRPGGYTWDDHAREVYRLLTKSDIVLIRCTEAGVDFPQAWKDYRSSLRALLQLAPANPEDHPIPAAPAYPEGT